HRTTVLEAHPSEPRVHLAALLESVPGQATLRRSAHRTQPLVAKPVPGKVRYMTAAHGQHRTAGSGSRDGLESASRTRGRRGRPMSTELDDRILEAALATLAEVGYTRLRLDALAA